MHAFFRTLSCATLALMLLTGCNQRPHQSQPPVVTQLDQLSALLAGSDYLKQFCARADIPDGIQLTRSALHMAKERGWDTQAAEYGNLRARTQARYQALQRDRTPVPEKCAALNRSTARFIAVAQGDAIN
jgi:general secretion pathway protein S